MENVYDLPHYFKCKLVDEEDLVGKLISAGFDVRDSSKLPSFVCMVDRVLDVAKKPNDEINYTILSKKIFPDSVVLKLRDGQEYEVPSSRKIIGSVFARPLIEDSDALVLCLTLGPKGDYTLPAHEFLRDEIESLREFAINYLPRV